MKVFHTSTRAIPKPDTRHSRNYLDFGKGFYLTPIEQQARDYGWRFLRLGKPAVMNIYRFDDDIPDATSKVFAAYDGEWLDFIAACRKGRPHRAYDVITGGIADDQVFNTVDLYLKRLITRGQALYRLRWKKPNLQICITSQAVLDRHLRFVKSIALKP